MNTFNDESTPVTDCHLDDPNDGGNARRFVKQHGRGFRFEIERSKWLVYDGKRWTEDRSETRRQRALETARSIKEEARSCLNLELQRKLMNWAETSGNKGHIEAMLELARSDPSIVTSGAAMNSDKFLFNVQNGTIDLRTRTLLPHRAEDLIEQLSGAHFDPEAKCPRWLAFLDRAMSGDQALIGYLQKVVGYTLTGSVRESELYLLHGAGANGKSVFLQVLSHLMGDYGKTADFTTFLEQKGQRIRNDLAGLRRSRLVTASETGPGAHLDETVIKQTTGGDSLSARYLYGEFFEFEPQFKIFLATNHLPHIRGTENGIWRRIRVIPWSVVIPYKGQNRNLAEDLIREELDGILLWAIEGCEAWQADGLVPPAAVTAQVEKYRERSDSVYEFVKNCCVLDSRAKVLATELKGRYEDWCSESDASGTPKLLKTRLQEMGCKHGKSGNWFWFGLRLKTRTEMELEDGASCVNMDKVDNLDTMKSESGNTQYVQSVLETVQKVQIVRPPTPRTPEDAEATAAREMEDTDGWWDPFTDEYVDDRAFWEPMRAKQAEPIACPAELETSDELEYDVFADLCFSSPPKSAVQAA